MTEAWTTTLRRAVDLRHQLHRTPELAWEEEQTAALIRRELTRLGIPWRVCARTGTVASLAPDAFGDHIALRGDIDGLPIQETSEHEVRSQVDGRMHACGHDGHAATLLAAAMWLKQHEAHLTGPVSLLFQPAEEGGHGARQMVEDGALKGVARIFGWHNWPAIAYGQALCPDGVVMAGNGTFEIHLQGQGGHASQPELCRDPILAASAITLAMQQVVARRLPPQTAAVVSITSIDGHSAPTVIRDTVVMQGSIRIADMSDRETVNALITQVAEGTAAAYGVHARVEHFSRYDPTMNRAEAAALMRTALAAEFGPDWRSPHPLPVMASEDFSYYTQQIPGAYALVGAQQEGRHTAPCHSPRYSFNDALLARMVGVYARLSGLPDQFTKHSME